MSKGLGQGQFLSSAIGADSAAAVAKRILVWCLQVIETLWLGLASFYRMRQRGPREIISIILHQIYFTGFQALLPVCVLGLAVGALVGAQSHMQELLFAGDDWIEKVFVAVVLREVAPLLTALLVIARSCTAVAAELGSMQAHREIAGLRVLGIDPHQFIALPRLVGGWLSVVALTVYFQVVALIGAFAVMNFGRSYSFRVFMVQISELIRVGDLVLLIAKTTVFGLGVFAIAIHEGLSVKSSPHEVPQATIRAVVRSFVFVFAANTAISVAFYWSQISRLLFGGG